MHICFGSGLSLVLGGFCFGAILMQTPAQGAEDRVAQEALRIVSQYRATFSAPPRNTPSDTAVDAPLMGNGDTLVAVGGDSGKMSFFINKNDLWVLRADKGAKPQPLARLDVRLAGMEGATYHVEQDLARAVTMGKFEKDGASISFETAVTATENLLWVKLSASGAEITGKVELYLPGQSEPQMERIGNGVQAVERRFESDVMMPSGAACAARVASANDTFTVAPTNPVLIVAAVCSRFDEADFRSAAIRRVSEFRQDDLDLLRTAHEAWWREFWGRSYVEIPDKAIEQRYYLSQYVLASASRRQDFPPGLFGWITTDTPGWNGDYHMNYNHVAPFYGLYASNHIEQADPCHGPILANADQARELCRASLGIEGLYQYVGIGPKGSISDPTVWMQKSNSSYSCVPLAFRWYATYDRDYAGQAYPFVRGVACFWENWLKFEDGRYVIYKDAIHEGSGDDFNPILSLGLVRMVMDLALDMSAELGVDNDHRQKWRHIRDNISDFPICTVADIPKKLRPGASSLQSLPIFRYSERGTPWFESNTLGIQHIFPAGAIGLDSPPELLERARNQIRVLDRWVDGNGMNSIYAAAARAGYDPNVILKKMRSMLDTIALPNGMIRDNPHGMEHQSIVPNAIQEMLFQSHEGVFRFFPCWPKDEDAAFGGLRARGAFLVNAELKGGAVCNVRIFSEKGRSCVIQNPWPGKTVRVTKNGQTAETVTGERFSLETAAGDTAALAVDSSSQ